MGHIAMAEKRTADAVPACMLAWLLPGLGHFYLRRTGKGLVFLLCLLGMYALGLAWDARLWDPRLQMGAALEDPLALLRGLAQMAMGIPYVVVRMLEVQGLVTSPTHEYGNTFTEVGGLLNVLVMLDAYDTAVGRKP